MKDAFTDEIYPNSKDTSAVESKSVARLHRPLPEMKWTGISAKLGQCPTKASPEGRVLHFHQSPTLPIARPYPSDPSGNNNSESCGQQDPC